MRTYCGGQGETRPCDCNYRKGVCHCSDSDCEWDPDPVFCDCESVEVADEQASRLLGLIGLRLWHVPCQVAGEGYSKRVVAVYGRDEDEARRQARQRYAGEIRVGKPKQVGR